MRSLITDAEVGKKSDVAAFVGWKVCWLLFTWRKWLDCWFAEKES